MKLTLPLRTAFDISSAFGTSSVLGIFAVLEFSRAAPRFGAIFRSCTNNFTFEKSLELNIQSF